MFAAYDPKVHTYVYVTLYVIVQRTSAICANSVRTRISNREFEVNLRRRHSGILYIVIDVCIA